MGLNHSKFRILKIFLNIKFKIINLVLLQRFKISDTAEHRILKWSQILKQVIDLPSDSWSSHISSFDFYTQGRTRKTLI